MSGVAIYVASNLERRKEYLFPSKIRVLQYADGLMLFLNEVSKKCTMQTHTMHRVLAVLKQVWLFTATFKERATVSLAQIRNIIAREICVF